MDPNQSDRKRLPKRSKLLQSGNSGIQNGNPAGGIEAFGRLRAFQGRFVMASDGDTITVNAIQQRITTPLYAGEWVHTLIALLVQQSDTSTF